MALDPYFEVRTPARNYGPATVGGVSVTPLARRLAAEAGIDLSAVRGSGPRNRIVAADIAATKPAAAAARAAPSGPSAADVATLYKDVPHEAVVLDNMRRTIAARLLQATQTIPHFYVADDLDVGALVALRQEINAAAPQ